MQAYMLRLQTVNKLSVAQEIRDQTLKETQEVSNALIAAEQRIGELLLAIPKQSGGINQYNKEEKVPNGTKSKSEIISEMGYGREYKDYQQMAKNPEIVQKVIADALANGEVVTKSQVLKEIKAEREKLKAEMQDLKEERDYLESKLEEEKNKEPEVKTVIKEVVPDDYEELKKSQASSLKDYRALESLREKDKEKIKELQRRIDDLESRKDIDELQKKLEEEAGYFAIRTYEYIQKNGGYVWITERMNQLPEKQRKEFVQTVYAIDAFAKQMVENIGGYGIE